MAATGIMAIVPAVVVTAFRRRYIVAGLGGLHEREEGGMETRTASAAMEALAVGKRVTVSKTVGETDVLLFAGISGDFAPIHVDEEFMKQTRYGRRIAHGALMLAYMSRASTAIIADVPGTVVSYGYDRIRFPAPVFIGDTVTVTYQIAERDVAAAKTFSTVTCTNQRGEVVAAATHILKVVEG
jgi:acyl dehydratase